MIIKDLPLMGTIMFGIIDRGSTLLQIRPTTKCNLQCPFCSTNPLQKTHYEIEPNHLIKEIKKIIKLKDTEIEANIDSVGEPTTYKHLTKLIENLNKIKKVKFISMQTNGTLLTKTKIKELEKAGLNRINLSIHTLNETKAKKLSGCESYNIKKIIQTAKDINDSKIELTITPVLLPRLNEEDIEELIKFTKELNCKIAIQKYEKYKYTKKLKHRQTWWKFYNTLTKLEKQYKVKLKYGPIDYNIKRTKHLPLTFQKGEKITTTIKLKGWLKNQMIGISKDKCITILDCNKPIEDKIKVKIIENKNNIYIAKQRNI